MTAGPDDLRMSFIPDPGEPWAGWYLQLYPPRLAGAFHRWKLATTAVDSARSLWELRTQRLSRWLAAHGPAPADWPVRHPPVVLERGGGRWYPACLGCPWLGQWTEDPADAHDLAAAHAADGGGAR